MTGSTRSDDLFPALFSAARSGHGTAPSSTAVAVQLDALRIAAGEADVLATVTLEWFDKGTGGDADQLQVERLAYLLGLIARATTAVVAAVDRFHAALADAQPAEGGDQWDREYAARPEAVPFGPVEGGANAGVGGPAKDEHPRR